jgi:ketosteroid isomerase-like protein
MKNIILIFATLLVLFHSNGAIQQDISTSIDGLQDHNRIEELNSYWLALARTAKEGDFNGMKSLYHEDAVLVKIDTTIAISEAFKFRWKKEIMQVKNGERANTVEFRFSKRIGNNITAFETGIFHYTSIETSTGTSLGDSYVHFETLLVKVNDQWVALMEYQKTEATMKEWEALH